MDFNRNVDKLDDTFIAPLYNSVLKVVFSSGESEPLTLQEAKDWMKLDDNDADDTIITALITAARRMCESFTGLGFIERDIVAGINNSDGGFNLPYGPITTSPSATDVDGNTLDLIYNLGQIESPMGRMEVSYTGGYSTLPEDLKTALKAQVLFLYENRGEATNSGLSPISKIILDPLRVVT